jgi:hypothetical protein
MALVAGILVAGCTHRMVVSIESHPQAPLMHLGIDRYMGDNVNAVVEYEFWDCREQSGQLMCRRQCGDRMDLACPTQALSIVTGR